MAEWSNGCINYFDAFDLAILNFTSKLNPDEKKSSTRRAVVLKKLLTIDGDFDKTLFDFILWIISDNNREITFSRMCDIKFLFAKSDVDMLKVFLSGTSRCFLEPSHLTWVLECLQGWKKKSEKEKLPLKFLNDIDIMISSTAASFEGCDPSSKFPPGSNENRQQDTGLDAEEEPQSTSELSNDEFSSKQFARGFSRIPSSASFASYSKSPSHKKSQSFNSLRRSQLEEERLNSAKDAEIQSLRQLLNYELPRPASFREVPYEVSNIYEPPLQEDFGLLLTTREQQIVALQTELRRKNSEISQLTAIKKNSASFSTADHSRLEKELRDMMKYYENALGSKEAELVSLQKKFKEKKSNEAESQSSSQELEALKVLKSEQAKQKELHAEAIAKLEDDLKKALIKYVTLHKNCEVKLERFRTELAHKNKIIASHAKYSKKSEHARYLYSMELENSVALIKEAQKRLEKELDDTKISRDTALLQVSAVENELQKYGGKLDSENHNPNNSSLRASASSSPAPPAGHDKSTRSDSEEVTQLRLKLHAMQTAELEVKKELRDTRENLRELERKYEETLLSQDGGAPAAEDGGRLTEKLKLEAELKVLRTNYEQLKSATDKIVSYEESRSKYIISLENKLKQAADDKVVIEKEFAELKKALELFKPWEGGTQFVNGLRQEMKRINSSIDAEQQQSKSRDQNIEAGIAGRKARSGSPMKSTDNLADSGESAMDPEKRQSEVQKAKLLFQKKLNITQNMIIAKE